MLMWEIEQVKWLGCLLCLEMTRLSTLFTPRLGLASITNGITLAMALFLAINLTYSIYMSSLSSHMPSRTYSRALSLLFCPKTGHSLNHHSKQTKGGINDEPSQHSRFQRPAGREMTNLANNPEFGARTKKSISRVEKGNAPSLVTTSSTGASCPGAKYEWR